jgi:hypothetical protein
MIQYPKETPKVEDALRIEGGIKGAKRGGLQSIDGKPLDPVVIARNFGVTVEEAKNIIRRFSL